MSATAASGQREDQEIQFRKKSGWPDVGLKSSPNFLKVDPKEAAATVFTYKVAGLKTVQNLTKCLRFFCTKIYRQELCEPMERLFFNIWPLRPIEICPKA